MSVGAGVGLLVAAVLAACFSERAWLRILCYVYLAIFYLANLGIVVFGDAPKERLLLPTAIGVFAIFVIEVKRKYDKW